MSTRKIIKTTDLTLTDIPLPDADWHKISLFAISFDIQAEMEGSNVFPDIRSFSDSSSILELRAYIYLQQRWWNNRSVPIDEKSLQ